MSAHDPNGELIEVAGCMHAECGALHEVIKVNGQKSIACRFTPIGQPVYISPDFGPAPTRKVRLSPLRNPVEGKPVVSFDTQEFIAERGGHCVECKRAAAAGAELWLSVGEHVFCPTCIAKYAKDLNSPIASAFASMVDRIATEEETHG